MTIHPHTIVSRILLDEAVGLSNVCIIRALRLEGKALARCLPFHRPGQETARAIVPNGYSRSRVDFEIGQHSFS